MDILCTCAVDETKNLFLFRSVGMKQDPNTRRGKPIPTLARSVGQHRNTEMHSYYLGASGGRTSRWVRGKLCRYLLTASMTATHISCDAKATGDVYGQACRTATLKQIHRDDMYLKEIGGRDRSTARRRLSGKRAVQGSQTACPIETLLAKRPEKKLAS